MKTGSRDAVGQNQTRPEDLVPCLPATLLVILLANTYFYESEIAAPIPTHAGHFIFLPFVKCPLFQAMMVCFHFWFLTVYLFIWEPYCSNSDDTNMIVVLLLVATAASWTFIEQLKPMTNVKCRGQLWNHNISAQLTVLWLQDGISEQTGVEKVGSIIYTQHIWKRLLMGF